MEMLSCWQKFCHWLHENDSFHCSQGWFFFQNNDIFIWKIQHQALCQQYTKHSYIDGLVQERCNSSALDHVEDFVHIQYMLLPKWLYAKLNHIKSWTPSVQGYIWEIFCAALNDITWSLKCKSGLHVAKNFHLPIFQNFTFYITGYIWFKRKLAQNPIAQLAVLLALGSGICRAL